MDTIQIVELLRKVDQVFTPSAPIDEQNSFQGRGDECAKILQGLTEPGQHIIIYGDRGVGKTSIANIVPKMLEDVVPVVRVICNRSDTFKQIWVKAFDQMPITFTKASIGYRKDEIQEVVNYSIELSTLKQVTTSDISKYLSLFKEDMIIFIFDEFDTLLDKKTRENFADLIKELSDTKSKIKIMIVGIASTILDLIGNHPSTQRCIRQVKIKRLLNNEVKNIAASGFDKIGLTYEDKLINLICDNSCGFGHYVHLLSKYIARYTISSGLTSIDNSFFYKGAYLAADNANETIKEEYLKAIATNKKNSILKNLVHSCAVCKGTMEGGFNTSQIITIYSTLYNKDITVRNIAFSLGLLCNDPNRGMPLEKIKGPEATYRFRNALLQVYIILLEANIGGGEN